MTSRPGIRPSRLGLIARLAVTAAVGAGAMTAAVLVRSTPALAGGRTSTAVQPSPLTVAQAEAGRLIRDFVAPPGASRLSSAPSDLPGAAIVDVTTVPYVVTDKAWWRTTQSTAADLISWLSRHPEQGLTAYFPDLQVASGSAQSVSFSGNPSDKAIKSIGMTVTAYSGQDGATTLAVSATVGYAPSRPATEKLPAAAKLIAVPTFAMGSNLSAPEVTVTDPATIARVEAVINGLSKAPTGRIECPMDNGAGMALVFEGSDDSSLADVVVEVTGCGQVQVSISGYNEPALSGGRQAGTLIQRILGTDWKLS